MFNLVKNAAETVVARPLEWASGAESFAGSIGRAGVVIAGWSGALLSPFLVWGHLNSKNLEDDIANIDNGKSSIFTSIDDCASHGNRRDICEKSAKESSGWIGALGTSVSYSSRQGCEKVHGTCEKLVTSWLQCTTVNKVTTCIPMNITSFVPPAVAWQAAATADLSPAVPLYRSKDNGQAIRSDGHAFSLNN